MTPELGFVAAPPSEPPAGQSRPSLNRDCNSAPAQARTLAASTAGQCVRNERGSHQLGDSRAKQAFSIQLSAIEQHQSKLQIVFSGGEQPAATGKENAIHEGWIVLFHESFIGF